MDNKKKVRKRIYKSKKHKGGNIDAREIYTQRVNVMGHIRNITATLQPCIQVGAFTGNLALLDTNGREKIVFERRIGSESVYGEAYLTNTIDETGQQRSVAIKIMIINDHHRQECNLLLLMTNIAVRGLTCNFPITYSILECRGNPTELGRTRRIVPSQMIRNRNYFVILNEVARGGDVENFFRYTHEQLSYDSLFLQMIFALQAFHQLGYYHSDAHLGNFLVHTPIIPGGFWQYTYRGTTIYVPNMGHLVVLWDPGLATPFTNRDDPISLHTQKNRDFKRVIELLCTMHTQVWYTRTIDRNNFMNVVHPGLHRIICEINTWLERNPTLSFMDYFIPFIASNFYSSVRRPQQGYIINETPYPLEFDPLLPAPVPAPLSPGVSMEINGGRGLGRVLK